MKQACPADSSGPQPSPAGISGAPRLPGLDLLRAGAIVWVVLFHSRMVGGPGFPLESLARFGWAGVDLFFILSGFLIGTQVLLPLRQGRPFSFGGFYARRAWRILPAYAVVLLLYLLVPVLREHPEMRPWWQFASFSFNLWTEPGQGWAFSHVWSLCVEEHFYLLFPLLAVGLARRPTMPRFVILCLALLLAGALLRFMVWRQMSAADPSQSWYLLKIYYPTWMRLDALLAGVMLATLRVYRPGAWQQLQARSHQALLLGLLLLGLALWLFRDRSGLLANAVGWPLLAGGFALLVFAAAHREGPLRHLKMPGIAWLAAVSYSLYLSHKIALLGVTRLLGSALQDAPLLRFLLHAVALLALAAALHYLVERPGLRWRDRLRGSANLLRSSPRGA